MNISVNLSSFDYRNDENSPMMKTMSLRAVMLAMLIAAGIIGLSFQNYLKKQLVLE
jgi:hypothetical protein